MTVTISTVIPTTVLHQALHCGHTVVTCQALCFALATVFLISLSFSPS